MSAAPAGTFAMTSADAVRVVGIGALQDELDACTAEMAALHRQRERTYFLGFESAYDALIKHRAKLCERIERLTTGREERHGD